MMNKSYKTLLAALRAVSEKVNTFEEALAYIKRNFGDYSGYFDPNLPEIEKELRDGLGKASKIYRCVSFDAGEDWVKGLIVNGTGIYWSYNPDRAWCHWGDKPVKVFLEARLPSNGVNWLKSVEMNLHHKYAAEEEVRLHQNAKVYVRSGRVEENGVDTITSINEIISSGASGTDD
jgi:hypothetical protein